MGFLKWPLLVITILFTWWGIWLLLPSRNQIGRPIYETLSTEYSIPNNGGVVRLYRGAVESPYSNWVSVTFEERQTGLRERQFFYARTWPEVTDMKCELDTVRLGVRFPAILSTDTFVYSIELIRSVLTKSPVVYIDGHERVNFYGRKDDVIVGFVLVGISLVSGLFSFRLRKWRPKRLEIAHLPDVSPHRIRPEQTK